MRFTRLASGLASKLGRRNINQKGIKKIQTYHQHSKEARSTGTHILWFIPYPVCCGSPFQQTRKSYSTSLNQTTSPAFPTPTPSLPGETLSILLKYLSTTLNPGLIHLPPSSSCSNLTFFSLRTGKTKSLYSISALELGNSWTRTCLGPEKANASLASISTLKVRK